MSGKILKGFTRFDNDTLDALICCPLIAAPLRCALYVIRMTWGYGREFTTLRPKNFVTACNITRKNVHRELKRAEEMKLIKAFTREGFRGVRYSIQSNISKWKMPSPMRMPSRVKANAFTGEGIHLNKRKLKEKKNNNKPLKKKSSEEFSFSRCVSAPAGFHLTDRMRSYAIEQGIDMERVDGVFAYFHDHHLAKGSKFKNWTRAWYTWVRNDIKFNKEPEDAFDRMFKRIEQAEAERAKKVGEIPE